MLEHTLRGVTVVTIETTDLGDRSYVVADGTRAAVIDPQRDVDRILELIEERGWTVEWVIETHIHNDYVTGGLDLAERTGASYGVNAADDVEFDRHRLEPGERIAVGDFELEVVHTPGHTHNHLAYVLRSDDEAVATFTGGSILYGAVGRTDLLGPDHTEELSHAQYQSSHHLGGALPETAIVYPTHGFGSFCSSSETSGADQSTVGEEKQCNPVFTTADEDTFVRELMAGYTAYPSYYRHMAPLNRAGPGPADLSLPETISESGLGDRIAGVGWVVDVRDRRAFAASHRVGTVNIEYGPYFTTYTAWVIPFRSEITLLADSEADVAAAVRSLARVGFDTVTGRAVASEAIEGGPTETYRVARFDDLAREFTRGEPVVLDVRRDDEWEGGHLRGAVHIHLPELPGRLDEVPGGEVWVHCAAGFRASIAASLVAAAGRDVVFIDDEWGRVDDLALDIELSKKAA